MHREFTLIAFDNSQTPARVSLDLRIERTADELSFSYRVSGSTESLSSLVWPDEKIKSAARRDELWKTTVFEFFLSDDRRPDYFEVNVAPTGDWNVYELSDYRKDLRPLTSVIETPLRSTGKNSGSRTVEGVLNLADFQLVGPVVLGATAVLEYQDGQKEYWALAHMGEKPDFHLRSSFTAQV